MVFSWFYWFIIKNGSRNAFVSAYKSILFRRGVFWRVLGSVCLIWHPFGTLWYPFVICWHPRWTLLGSLAFHCQRFFHLSELTHLPTEWSTKTQPICITMYPHPTVPPTRKHKADPLWVRACRGPNRSNLALLGSLAFPYECFFHLFGLTLLPTERSTDSPLASLRTPIHPSRRHADNKSGRQNSRSVNNKWNI